MKQSLILVTLCSAMVTTFWAAPLPPPKEVSLAGTFVWSNMSNITHKLHGQLTATGSNEWKAVWTFKWGGKSPIWSGTVKGNLHNGRVSGTGEYAEFKERFAFDGAATDGAIKFVALEVTKGRTVVGAGELRVAN